MNQDHIYGHHLLLHEPAYISTLFHHHMAPYQCVLRTLRSHYFHPGAREEAEAKKLIADAHLLEEIGCFAIVLEKIPAALAAQVASELTIPIIGIGAGGGVDGQVLVMHDMLGINQGFSPRFLRRYANLAEDITRAVQTYIEDVKTQDFPNEKEQY